MTTNKLRERVIKLSSEHQPLEFIRQRKYNPELLKQLGIGLFTQDAYNQVWIEFGKEAKPTAKYLGKVIFPFTEDYFSARDMDRKAEKKNLFPPGTKKPYFIRGQTNVCYITEGETSALALKHIYPDANIFSLGGAGSFALLKSLGDYFPKGQVVLALDNDEEGQKCVQNCLRVLSPLSYEVKQLKWDEKFKDPDDLWREYQEKSPDQFSLVDVQIPQRMSKAEANEKRRAELADIKEGVSEGERNEACFKLARHYYNKGMSHDETLVLLKEWNINNNPPLEDHELERTLNSAYQYKTTQETPHQPSPIFMGINSFNEESKIFISKDGDLYHHTSQSRNEDNVSWKTLYILYRGSIGSGNLPIFIKSIYRLDLGDQDLYLREMGKGEIEEMLKDMKRDFLIHKLCKELKVATTKRVGRDWEKRNIHEIIQDILERDSTFFEPILAVSKETLPKIGNPLKAAKQIIKNNLEKSDIIDISDICNIPEVNPHKIRPREYMQFAPHEIRITNPKTGKSTNAMTITGEPPVERPSEAGLLGFADSQKAVPGKLHERTKQLYIDEVQEEKEEELLGKLHTYMEKGETTIQRGLGVVTKGYAGITFQGNPKLKEEMGQQAGSDGNRKLLDLLMYKQFRGFITIITKNVQAFSSRIGWTIFDNTLKPVVGTSNPEQAEQGIKILRSLAEGFKDEFTSLFSDKKVYEMLTTTYDEDYLKQVDNIADSCDDSIVRDYIIGHKESYKHARGVALRLAFLEVGIPSIWENGSIDIPTLCESTNEHLKTIQRINLASFLKIVSMQKEGVLNEVLKSNVKNISPEYVKLCVYCFFEWLAQNEDTKAELVTLAEIGAFYNNIKDVLKIDQNHKYRSWSRVSEFMVSSSSRLDLSWLSLDFDSEGKYLIMLDKEKIKKYLTLYQEIFKGTKDTKDTEQQQDKKEEKGTKDTKDTENTEKEGKPGKSVSFVPCDPVTPQRKELENDYSLADLQELPSFELLDKTHHKCAICGGEPCYYRGNSGKLYCAVCALTMVENNQEATA